MKRYNKPIALTAALLALAMLTLTGCWGNNPSSSSSAMPTVPPMPSATPSSMAPPSDNSPSVPSESGANGSASAPGMSSTAPGASNNAPGASNHAPGTSMDSSSVAALGTDFEGIGALPSKSLDWGPGGPVDSLNRSEGALLYNKLYGKYNSVFIADDSKTVYMTFDEGYEFGLTGSILDTLKEKNVKAMFFVTYDFANRSGELVRRMIDEGHAVGNHSYSHKNYSALTPKDAAADMMRMHDFVAEKFNYQMKYFRFPSGNFNEQSLAAVQKMGYRTVFWSFAYKDWITDAQPDPAVSAEKITKAVCPGNIYLLHAVSSTNDQILGDIIDRIRAQGYSWGDPETL
ncbi:MAG: polysaccharide deacetylase family protein [Angelakisella sp.]